MLSEMQRPKVANYISKLPSGVGRKVGVPVFQYCAGTAREMAQRKGGCVNNNNIVERNALSQIFIFDGASFGPCVRWCYALVSRFVDG
jgi:hypothetical protein